ncbi:MAG: hypothetical protein PHG85_04915 [Candidatus Altiarchaeota archaeon]|nr:hypothetical protein [Candidatus Altiarchaeota archaeon]
MGVVTEIRCTCNSCGEVWHYLPSEESNAKTSECCNNCLYCGDALFTAGRPIVEQKVVQKIDLDRINSATRWKKSLNTCPKCNSGNIKKETITYNVDK